QHPRSQPPLLPSGDVLPQRHLIAGAAEEVAGDAGVELLAGRSFEVGDVDQIVNHRGCDPNDPPTEFAVWGPYAPEKTKSAWALRITATRRPSPPPNRPPS